jgi:hypothetical protein
MIQGYVTDTLFRSFMHRFIVRDFTYDEEAITKSKRDLEDLVSEEKQLWVSLSFPSLSILTSRTFATTKLTLLVTSRFI